MAVRMNSARWARSPAASAGEACASCMSRLAISRARSSSLNSSASMRSKGIAPLVNQNRGTVQGRMTAGRGKERSGALAVVLRRGLGVAFGLFLLGGGALRLVFAGGHVPRDLGEPGDEAVRDHAEDLLFKLHA